MSVLIVVGCTIIVILLTLFNLFFLPALNERFVKALEKDIARILRDKGIF